MIVTKRKREAETEMKIRLLIVDDHALVRAGYRAILGADPNIEIVGEGESGEDALRLVRDCDPDVLLLDISMPGLGGVEVTHRLASAKSRTRIAIVSMHGEGPLPRLLLDSGASAFLTKGCAAEELLTAVRQCARGQRYVGADLAQRLALSTGARTPFDELTPREVEVALLLGRGERPGEIGRRLHVSEKTVHTYKSRVLDKCDVNSQAELAVLLVRHGLIDR